MRLRATMLRPASDYAAWQKNRFLGIKHVTIYPENGSKHGLPGLHSTYTLFDAQNGVPVAVLDGNQITCRRTAAARRWPPIIWRAKMHKAC